MKKVLSLLLAVVLVCSMATVAFAALPTEKVCANCGAVTTSAAEYNAHITNDGCGKCAYCNNPFTTAEELSEHQYNYCLDFTGKCDYCGNDYAGTEAGFDAHVEACKAKYFGIPLAKIIAAVKDIIAKIDFEKVIGTVKDLAGKVVPVVQDLLGNIKLPA